MTKGIWKSIIERFLGTNERDSSNYIIEGRYTDNIKEFKHTESDEFDDIMRHLTKETGGNIHDNGTVDITSNSISGGCHPKNLVDYQTENDYNSTNNGDAYICFDFKNKAVNLTSYTMKSNNNSSGRNTLVNWVIEVSNDKQKWEEIDRHEDVSSLKGSEIVATFNMKKQNNKFYRFVRLRQTGDTWGSPDNKIFWFYYIEFYGRIKYENK